MFGFIKKENQISESQKKINDSIFADLKVIDLQISKAFNEITQLNAKYEALSDLYAKMKGRTNRMAKVEEETENINSQGVLKTN